MFSVLDEDPEEDRADCHQKVRTLGGSQPFLGEQFFIPSAMEAQLTMTFRGLFYHHLSVPVIVFIICMVLVN